MSGKFYKARIEMLLGLLPMTAREIAEDLRIEPRYASKLIWDLRQEKRVYIKHYWRAELFGRMYPRAVYAVGKGRDSKRIGPMTKSEYNDRCRTRKRTAVPSVFMLGVPVDTRRTGDAWKKVKMT